MFKSFYSLSNKPFNKSIKTTDLYHSESYNEAKARLDYLINTRGISTLVGEPGSGKTSSLRSLADRLDPALYKVIYFPLSTGTVKDFYSGLVQGLGEVPKFRKVDLFKQIQSGINNLYKNKKITPIFILDEMQLAPNKFLNDLSILFNFAMDSENPFVLILAGLPFFMNKLSLNQNQSLYQRVIMKYHMEPLNKAEVKGYIEHHLKLAGANHTIFTPPAIEAIFQRTKGLPRLINNLATNSLILGFQMNANQINEEIVFKACDDVKL